VSPGSDLGRSTIVLWAVAAALALYIVLWICGVRYPVLRSSAPAGTVPAPSRATPSVRQAAARVVSLPPPRPAPEPPVEEPSEEDILL